MKQEAGNPQLTSVRASAGLSDGAQVSAVLPFASNRGTEGSRTLAGIHCMSGVADLC